MSKDELTPEQLAELEEAFASADNSTVKLGAMGKIAGLKEGVFNFLSGLYSSPAGQDMWRMSKQVGTELLYQQAGMLLQKQLWKTVHRYTGPFAKRYPVVHHIFHSKVGMAANTVLLCQVGAFFCMKFAERAELSGSERKANAYRGAAKALLYSAGAGVVEIFDIPSLVDSIADKIMSIGKEAGVDFEQLGMDKPIHTDATGKA